jgi:ABC-type sugar transport system substrate-binding protein
MNRKTNLIIYRCIIIVFAINMLFSGCTYKSANQGNTDEKKVRKVAFSQTEGINPWTTDMINSFKKAANSKNMELIYHNPEVNSSEWQLQDLYSLLDEDIDYLVVFPRETRILEGVLKKAREKGVSVILLSQQADAEPGVSYLTTIYTDYKKEGQKCAQVLVEKFARKPCKIIEIVGTEGSVVAMGRSLGFRLEIKKHPNMTIVDVGVGDFDRLIAQRTMENIIQNNPNAFNAVFAHSDEAGLGVLQALKVAGYAPGKEVSIVSVNGVQDVLKAIIAGEYTATVESNPKVGYVAFDIIEQAERGFEPSKHVVMPYQVFDEGNAEYFLAFSY